MFFTLVYLTTLYFLITSESLKRAVLMVPLLIGAYLLGKWAMFKAVESNGEILVWLAGAVILAVGIIPWLHRKASENTPSGENAASVVAIVLVTPFVLLAIFIALAFLS